MSLRTTLEIAGMMETKVPNFVSTICQGQLSVITAVNSLLTSKGCFVR